jgi:antitoxin component YwqK of YwqJK toxin-antitoxin module
MLVQEFAPLKYLASIGITLVLFTTACEKKTEVVETTNEFGRKIRYERKKEDFAKHGLYERFYENGVKAEEAQYENDTLHGFRRFFYESGQLEAEEHFVRGLHHGFYKKYFESGQLEIQQEFINGAMQGKCIRYYPSGKIMEEVTIKDSEENGPFKEYYENGNPKAEGNYIYADDAAAEQGELREYDSTGVLVRIAECDAGVCRTKWKKE